MHKIFLAAMMVVLSLTLIACSNDTPTNQPPATVDPNTIGVSVGARSQATIGPAGGTLVSSDGVAKLVVPAGALSVETTISIEPVTNTAPGGIGRAYRMLPAGLVFSTPASLSIGFGIGIAPLPGVAIAYQGSDTIWQGLLAASQTDTLQRLVTAKISHFTDFAIYRRWLILPQRDTVEVGKDITVTVYTTDSPEIDKTTVIAPLVKPYIIRSTEVKGWGVESILGGDILHGRIKGEGAQGIYTAPKGGPPTNPVSLEATIDRSAYEKSDEVVKMLVTVSWPGGVAGTFFGTWEITWEGIDSIYCYPRPDVIEPGRTMVFTGIDTITIEQSKEDKLYNVIASGRTNSVVLRNPLNCSDPAAEYDAPVIIQQPTINEPGIITARPDRNIAGLTPYNLIFNHSGWHQPGILRRHRNSPPPTGDEVRYLSNSYGFTSKIVWPLATQGKFGYQYTTDVTGTGPYHFFDVHGTYRKIR